MWLSGFPEIYAQVRGVHWPLVYVHSSICETLFGVVVFQRFMFNGGYIGPWYMCSLLYMKLIWCRGVHRYMVN